MGVHDGHRARRRALFEKSGLSGFADHEVLELILYYAIPRRDTNELAHELIGRFGSLENVLAADREELAAVKGLGPNSAALLTLFEAVRQRLDEPELPEEIVNCVEDVGDYFLKLLCRKRQEMFYLLCVDAKGKVQGCHLLSQGSGNMTQVSVRQVVERVVHTNCDGVFLAHNHPSGMALPSGEDLQMTRLLGQMLNTMGVRLLDHIIVADGDYVSMAQSGYLLK